MADWMVARLAAAMDVVKVEWMELRMVGSMVLLMADLTVGRWAEVTAVGMAWMMAD